MAKFCDPKIWDEDWFCEMPGEYQLFVKYVFDKCDNAGVWKPNKFDFETKTKFKVSIDCLFKKINDGCERVLLLENGRWFITGYILFQWFNKKKTFDLVLSNKLHKSLYEILLENKIPLKKVRGLKEVLKRSMVMDNVKEELLDEELINEELKKKNVEKFPSEKDLKLELPEIKIGSAIELVRLSNRIDLTKEEVLQFWEVFKVQNFTGEKFYADVGAIHSHFISWIKMPSNFNLKSYNGTSKSNSTSSNSKSEQRQQNLVDFVARRAGNS